MDVVLQARKARPFFARHPWVFAGSIARVDGEPVPGAEVRVLSHENDFIARGLFNPRSAIRVRLYRWTDEPLDHAFWRERLAAAITLRTDALKLSAGAYRLVFSEADGVSGLTADRYDRWLVATFTSLALFERREMLIELLLELTSAAGVVVRTESGIAGREGLPRSEPFVVGEALPQPLFIRENDIEYEVDLEFGQKGGLFLDQRENRRIVAEFAKRKDVLDLYCNAGGFSLNALRHGDARSALGIDSSARAIAAARRNAERNALQHAEFQVGDVHESVDRLAADGKRFGLVICDPPKFAPDARKLESAIKGYLRLNRSVVDVIEPGGILATCSCSGLVDRAMFAQVLGQVAELSGRPIQILRSLGQAPDHPVSASCLESEYLKCFVCLVG